MILERDTILLDALLFPASFLLTKINYSLNNSSCDNNTRKFIEIILWKMHFRELGHSYKIEMCSNSSRPLPPLQNMFTYNRVFAIKCTPNMQECIGVNGAKFSSSGCLSVQVFNI